MKIMITAGGTSEKIDQVRKITNMSTGRLGSLIAEEFVRLADAEISYICGENAMIPDAKVDVTRISSAEDLQNTMMNLFSQCKYDAVIHSMAVSDYKVRGAAPFEDIISAVAESVYNNNPVADDYSEMTTAIRKAVLVTSEKKISSDINNLVVFMKKTPKIINMIRELQPGTVLVGFKLLAGADDEALHNAGRTVMDKNKCDFVFANDFERINGDKHEGILIRKDISFFKLNTKQEIAEAITRNVISSVRV